jgi:hypothetical protein
MQGSDNHILLLNILLIASLNTLPITVTNAAAALPVTQTYGCADRLPSPGEGKVALKDA